MAQVIRKLTLPHIDLAFVLAFVWIALAFAAAVYDIGRWFHAW